MGTSTRGSSSLCPYPNGSLQEVSPAAHRLPMAPSVTTWPQQLSTSLRMSGHVETDECHRSMSFSSCLGQFCHMSNRRDTCLEFANNVCYPAARPTDLKPMEPIYRMCLAGKGQERTTYDIEWQQESKRCNTKTNFFLRWKNSFAHAIQPNVLQISRCKICVAFGNKQFRPEKKEAVDRHIVVTFCHLLLLIVTCCYLLSHVVTCCYLLLLLIVTCCHMLLLVVTCCHLLSLVVTCCYLLLLLLLLIVTCCSCWHLLLLVVVTYCYLWSHVVTCCYLLSPVVTCCHLLLLVVVTYCYLLSHVVTCCYLLSLVVTCCCYLLLLVVTCCYLLLLVVVTYCYLLSLVVTCCCYLLLLVVTCCYLLLLIVTPCYLWSPVVTCCYFLLSVVICLSGFVVVSINCLPPTSGVVQAARCVRADGVLPPWGCSCAWRRNLYIQNRRSTDRVCVFFWGDLPALVALIEETTTSKSK